MLSGRPVLAAVAENSDTARIIQQAECGVFVPPEEPMAIASEIRHLMQVPEKLKQMGESARYYTQKNFSGKACLPKLINILESLEKKH
jgi:colanic acid biosynthesis glycosyl transferase WcaI